MDGQHHQHQPHHQGNERNQSHDPHNHDHSHGTEGRNETEVLDEVFIHSTFYLSESSADDIISSFFSILLFFFFFTPWFMTKKVNGKFEFKSSTTRTSFLNHDDYT